MRILITLPAIALVAGCLDTGMSTQQETDLVNLCLLSEQVGGQYWIEHSITTSSDPADQIPAVRPITQLGGTARGADKINACIKREIAAGTPALLP
jgi:hypothetical protein